MQRTKAFFLILLLAALSVFIVSAQTDDTLQTLRLNNIAFQYDQAMFNNVNIVWEAGTPDAENLPSPAIEMPHTQFRFYNGQSAPESTWDNDGHIRVYAVADLETNADYAAVLDNLRALLDESPVLDPYMTAPMPEATPLPFLPIFPASQILRAQASYVESDSLRVVAYLNVWRQDVSPISSPELMYTFQGLSADGRYYVSAYFKAGTELLPQQAEAVDLETFSMNQHLIEVTTALNEAAPESFQPSLASLDAIIRSIEIE